MEKKKDILPAKVCYSHIGGKLGTLLMETFIEKGWIARQNPADKHFGITALGEKEFSRMGLDLSKIKKD